MIFNPSLANLIKDKITINNMAVNQIKKMNIRRTKKIKSNKIIMIKIKIKVKTKVKTTKIYNLQTLQILSPSKIILSNLHKYNKIL